MAIHDQIEFSTNNIDDILNSKIKISVDDMINFRNTVYEKFGDSFISFIRYLEYDIIKNVNIKVYIEDILLDNINIFCCDRVIQKELGLPESIYIEDNCTIIKILDNNDRLYYFDAIKKTSYKYRIDVIIEFSKLENLIICKNNKDEVLWKEFEIDKDISLNCELIRYDQNNLHNSSNEFVVL